MCSEIKLAFADKDYCEIELRSRRATDAYIIRSTYIYIYTYTRTSLPCARVYKRGRESEFRIPTANLRRDVTWLSSPVVSTSFCSSLKFEGMAGAEDGVVPKGRKRTALEVSSQIFANDANFEGGYASIERGIFLMCISAM